MRITLCGAVSLVFLLAFQPATGRADPDDDALTAFNDGAFAEALAGWMHAAATGDAAAARYVGMLYDTGKGVAQDQAAALRWYKQAAGRGDVPAMFNVAVCFDAGRGTARDPMQAAYWYRQAANHRFGRAEYNLALMQQDGDGVPRDRPAAALMFRAALRDGIEAARSHLPDDTLRPRDGGLPGSGRPEPSTAPAVVTSDAAFASAQRALLGRAPDASSRAAALFAQAASNAGPAGSMARYDLAWCYQNGIGVPIDKPRAYRIFIQVAAETDDPFLGNLARTAAEHDTAPPVMVSSASRPAAPEK